MAVVLLHQPPHWRSGHGGCRALPQDSQAGIYQHPWNGEAAEAGSSGHLVPRAERRMLSAGTSVGRFYIRSEFSALLYFSPHIQ